MAALQGIDPSMLMHLATAMLAGAHASHIGMPEVTNNLPLELPVLVVPGQVCTGRLGDPYRIMIERMVTILEPLGRLDNDWLLAIFHQATSGC